MRKEISIPSFLVDAIKDVQEAFNISYISAGLPSRHRDKKYKENEYSFSAIVCHLIIRGIEAEFNISQKTDKKTWVIPDNCDKYQNLIKDAYQKSLKFNIDSPHRYG